jgi:hypothetical protein
MISYLNRGKDIRSFAYPVFHSIKAQMSDYEYIDNIENYHTLLNKWKSMKEMLDINIQNINTNEIKIILLFLDIINKIKFNFNLYNIDGNIPGHILAKNIIFFDNNKLNVIINNILTNSDINLQNFEGDSILFLLVKNNYWNNVKNILINKKLNIFILDNKQKIFFDFIKNKNLNNFIELVTDSFINNMVKIVIIIFIIR